jgi:putative transposase
LELWEKRQILWKGHQTSIEEENRKLKRENEILRTDQGNSKKSYEHLHAAPSVKYGFIQEHRHLFPVVRMCHVLGVSENGYYNWRKRGKSQRKQDDEYIAQCIEDAYDTNRGVYGSPRIHAELKAQGIHCGRKRIVRLMQEKGISARRKRRKARTTNSNHSSPIAPNLLERDFEASAPNKKWVTDITYIATYEGWLYLTGILDMYSRKLIGWAMGK